MYFLFGHFSQIITNYKENYMSLKDDIEKYRRENEEKKLREQREREDASKRYLLEVEERKRQDQAIENLLKEKVRESGIRGPFEEAKFLLEKQLGMDKVELNFYYQTYLMSGDRQDHRYTLVTLSWHIPSKDPNLRYDIVASVHLNKKVIFFPRCENSVIGPLLNSEDELGTWFKRLTPKAISDRIAYYIANPVNHYKGVHYSIPRPSKGG